MKKFLLTAALILALVTSLSAGTMAAYYNEVATIESAVTTKSWTVTEANRDAKFSEVVKLAPGDSAIYTIDVVNGSEVSATIAMTSSLDNAPEGLTVVCDKANSLVLAKEGGTTTYAFTVSYDYDEGKESSKDVVFNVSFNATSVNEGNTVVNA